MNNVLIDERRVHVDFSQSVAKLWNTYKNKEQKEAVRELVKKESGLGGRRVREERRDGRSERRGDRSRERRRDESRERGRRRDRSDSRERGRRRERKEKKRRYSSSSLSSCEDRRERAGRSKH